MHKFLIDSIKTKQNANGDQEVDLKLKPTQSWRHQVFCMPVT